MATTCYNWEVYPIFTSIQNNQKINWVAALRPLQLLQPLLQPRPTAI